MDTNRQLLRLKTSSQLMKVALAELRKFDPNEPRDNIGRWTSGGGGASAALKPWGRKSPVSIEPIRDLAHAKQVANEVADSLGFPRRKVSFASPLGTKLFWNIVVPPHLKVMGAYNVLTGNVTVFPNAVVGANKALLTGVLSHEITHAKFAKFIKAGGDVVVMSKYRELEKSDGTTPYSKMYWRQVWRYRLDQMRVNSRGQATLVADWNKKKAMLAVNETLAEMARMKYQGAGKLQGAVVWKDLYNQVDRHWAR